MFSLFQEDVNPEGSETNNNSQLTTAQFQAELYGTNQPVSSDVDQVFFDWQGSLCGTYNMGDDVGANYSSMIAQGNNMVVDDAFLASLNEGFGGYFAQTGISGNAFTLPTSPTHHQINPEFMRVPENADSPSLNSASDNTMMISMADVLPQANRMALKKIPLPRPPTPIRPKEKKVIKDKGGITKVKKGPKAVSLLPNTLLQLASAADPGTHIPPSAAPAVSTEATPIENSETQAASESAPIDCVKSEPDESNPTDSSEDIIEEIEEEQDVEHIDEDRLSEAPETLFAPSSRVLSPVSGTSQETVNIKLERPVAIRPSLGPTQNQYTMIAPQSQKQQCLQPSTTPSSITTPQPPTSSSRHKREKPTSHTPRPPNSFIIYRKEKHAELMSQSSGTSTLNNNVISKIVGTMWKQEPPEVKAMYAAKAQEEKRVHMLKHPDYKYRPKKSPPKQTSGGGGNGGGGAGRPGMVAMVPMASGGAPRFVKMGGGQVQRQNSGGAGSMSVQPSNRRNSSTVIGGMGMSLPTMDDFQYCQQGMLHPEFFQMQQGMYAPQQYQMGSPFDQQHNWGEGDTQAHFGVPVYWTTSQLQQSPQAEGSPGKYFQSSNTY